MAIRYNQADQAIRRGDLPPGGEAPVLIAVAVAAVAVLLLILVALDIRASNVVQPTAQVIRFMAFSTG